MSQQSKTATKLPMWIKMLRFYGHHFPVDRGKGRITRWAYHSLPRIQESAVGKVSSQKLFVEFFLWLWADFCSYCMKSPELYTLKYFLSIVRPQSIVFDIGAYMGTYSLYACSIATNGKVYAFEPNPYSASRITQTISRNNIHNLYNVNAALSSSTDKMPFTIHPIPTQSSLTPTLDTQDKIIMVPVYTLDTYCEKQGINHIDLIKIDVEGAEQDVLLGGQNIITQCRPTIIIELHQTLAKNYQHTSLETIQYLTQLNYQLFVLRKGLSARPSLEKFDGTINQSRIILVACP